LTRSWIAASSGKTYEHHQREATELTYDSADVPTEAIRQTSHSSQRMMAQFERPYKTWGDGVVGHRPIRSIDSVDVLRLVLLKHGLTLESETFNAKHAQADIRDLGIVKHASLLCYLFECLIKTK
jgi:hypothetical protein